MSTESFNTEPDEQRDQMLLNLERELAGRTEPSIVRSNCAFCGRERTRADDNHAPSCAYWQFFPEVS